MKLPNAHLATVSIDKVVGYLLSPTHPRGKSKAVFFRNLGFDESAPESLATNLTRHAMENDVLHEIATEFGGAASEDSHGVVHRSWPRNTSFRDRAPNPRKETVE